MLKAVFNEEDKRALRAIARELHELRKLVEELAETVVNMSDKELLKSLDASQDDLKESKMLNYRESLEKQIDIAEKEFRSCYASLFFETVLI